MKCPTCGKPVKRGQSICSFCGAMVAEATPKSPAAKPSDFHPPSFEEKNPPPGGKFETEEQEWPSFETMEGKSPTVAEPSTAEKAPPARPAAPAWVRLISPLFFILIALAMQYWVRNSDSPADSQPVLRDAGFSASVPSAQDAGQSVSRKTNFSLKDDRQVVFFSTWSGTPAGHSYSVVWHSPDGGTRRSSQTFTRSQSGGRQFSYVATLMLGSSLPLGQWRLELSQDREVVSRYTFQLQE